jgi:alcohol dehydrogenase
MEAFDFQPLTRVVFGEGSLGRLGSLARELSFRRTLLVADPGLAAAGHVERASRVLGNSGVEVFAFHGFGEDPDTDMVEAGRGVAAAHRIDSLVGLGGGSSMDCAKGINFLLSNGGRMQDYRGYGKTARPMLPMIGVPTTAGTGSEAQSYALISDARTHVKMACGDPQAAFRVALLDPELTVSQPRPVTAITGLDAIAHAVETHVSTKRNPLSDLFSREAFRLLAANFERVLSRPDDLPARAAMQLGAYFAGVAIENSMLGATHACANPVTAHFGTTHGVAISLLLPHVIRWNGAVAADRYAALDAGGPEGLARRIEGFVEAAGLPRALRDEGVPRDALPQLAEEAAREWTGRFNPRPVDAAAALEVYRCAY